MENQLETRDQDVHDSTEDNLREIFSDLSFDEVTTTMGEQYRVNNDMPQSVVKLSAEELTQAYSNRV